MEKIRVTIWNEFHHERTVEKVRNLYPNGMHMTLAEKLADDRLDIRVATLDMPEHGLTDEVLNNTDVLLWWGHCRHDAVDDRVAAKVARRVKDGMGFLPLHSAHMSKPFRLLMGTDCNLRWRNWGERGRVWTVNPTHPIAKGIPPCFMLESEEMYGEFFNIPKPDDIVFITWWEGGEVFRGGCTFTRGLGKIFYFHPGHETCPSYHNDTVIKVIRNGIDWCAPAGYVLDNPGHYRDPDEPIVNKDL